MLCENSLKILTALHNSLANVNMVQFVEMAIFCGKLGGFLMLGLVVDCIAF